MASSLATFIKMVRWLVFVFRSLSSFLLSLYITVNIVSLHKHVQSHLSVDFVCNHAVSNICFVFWTHNTSTYRTVEIRRQNISLFVRLFARLYLWCDIIGNVDRGSSFSCRSKHGLGLVEWNNVVAVRWNSQYLALPLWSHIHIVPTDLQCPKRPLN